MKKITLLATLLLAALGTALGQSVIPGVSTRIANGTVLPSGAGINTLFVLQAAGTPTLYICNANPCTGSGQWVASGGGGGGGSGANQALSNLSGTTAVNVGINAASGVTMTVSGFNGTSGSAPTNAIFSGGNAYTSSTQTPGNATVLGGTGQAHAGGNAYLLGGPANSGQNGGNAYIAGANATGTGVPGSVYVQSGTSSGNVQPGQIQLLANGSLNGAGNIYLEPAVQTGTSLPGTVFLWFGSYLEFNGGGGIGGGAANAENPSNIYVGSSGLGGSGGVYAPSFASATATYPLATQATAAWNAQGLYAGSPTSQTSQQTLSFIAGGGLGYSFNGGGVYTVANLTSNITGNSGTATAFAATPAACPANTFMTGVDVKGNCISSTPNIISMQETGTQTSASGQFVIWGNTATHGPMYSENGGPALPLGAYPNITNTLLGVANGNTVEISSGSNAQALYLYQTTDNTNYSRVFLGYDSGSGDQALWSQSGGSGSGHNLGLGVGSAIRWEINQSGFAFRPALGTTNTQDFGDATHQIRNLYLGTAQNLNGSWGTSGQCLQSGGGGTGSSPSGADSWGSCGGGGSMTWPGAAGVAVYGGSSAWATSLTVTGSGTYSVTGLSSLTGAASGAIITADGSGNVQNSTTLLSSLAPKASPVLTGTPTAPTETANDTTTDIATDAFVMGQLPGLTQPFMPFGLFASLNQAPFPTGANTAGVWGFNIDYAVTTSKFFYRVGTTADNTSNTYGVAILNSSGTLVLSYSAAGTSFAPSSSATKNASWTQGSTTLQPGKYYLEVTTSCSSSCATFSGGGGGTITFYSNTAVSVSAGGTPQSITAPGTGFESLTSTPLAVMLE